MESSSGLPLTEEQLGLSPEELATAAKLPLTVMPDAERLYEWLARTMADEIKDANAEDRPTRWVLPVGPKNHYRRLAEISNSERISWRNVHTFNMDEWCDWEGRTVPTDHPYNLEAFMRRNLFDLIKPDLRQPEEQIVFPSPTRIDEFSERIAAVGGIDTTFAGFGFRGHVAFNEPPTSRWTNVTLDDLRRSRTRLVQLSDDTLIAHSHRTAGGNTYSIPPTAVTIGMGDILASRRIRLLTDGGAWKQYILRVLLLGEPDVRFPVTLCQDHPDCTVTVDASSAQPLPCGV
jgi:glucosamine-6-phosphate deaminase